MLPVSTDRRLREHLPWVPTPFHSARAGPTPDWASQKPCLGIEWWFPEGIVAGLPFLRHEDRLRRPTGHPIYIVAVLVDDLPLQRSVLSPPECTSAKGPAPENRNAGRL